MASAPMPVTFFQSLYRPSQPRWPAFFRAWLPVLLFAVLLALESSAAFGSNRTSTPLHNLCHSVLGSAADRNWSLLHYAIRKSGHFAGYALFSLLVFRALRLSPLSPGLTPSAFHALAVVSAFLAACSDEFHQSFLPNRTGSFHDVLLDSVGALTLQLALFFTLRILTGTRSHPAPAAVPIAPSAGPPLAYVE